jgi:hypothetical protein
MAILPSTSQSAPLIRIIRPVNNSKIEDSITVKCS